MAPCGKFKRLVSREVSFTTKSKDLVRFELVDGSLELSINGTFGKSLQVLRLPGDHLGGRTVADQDDWTAVVPAALLKVTEKIVHLATVAQVPIFTYQGSLLPRCEDSALLQLQDGQLTVSWLESQRSETTSWPGQWPLAAGIEKVAQWLAKVSHLTLAVQEPSASEVHLHSLRHFAPSARAACIVVPTAAQGYALALSLVQLLEMPSLLLLDDRCSDGCALAKSWLETHGAANQGERQLIWSCPPDAATKALTLMEELLRAYHASRPFVHALIGSFGILESDLVEALETSVDFLRAAEVLPMPLALNDQRPSLLPKRKRLVPVGRGAMALDRLVQEELEGLWHHETQSCGGPLVMLDLADPDALNFLRAEQAGPTPHVLALLPGMSAPRSAWTKVAEPLAILLGAGEEPPDLGLVLGVCVGDSEGLDVRDCVMLLEALATVVLEHVEFQLRPFPQIHLTFASFEEAASPMHPTVLGNELGLGEVTTSFSLWPSGFPPRLLPEEFLKPDLPALVARGGSAYEAAKPWEPRVWHLVLDEDREATVLKRAAGDFAGRAAGAFHFRGGEDGPSSHLWALAQKLEGQSEGVSPDVEAVEQQSLEVVAPPMVSDDGGYSDDYEEEDVENSSKAESDAGGHDGD